MNISNEELSTGVESIDSVDYVVKCVRAIKRYLSEREKMIEDTKISEDAKGANLQQEKAFKAGAIAEIKTLNEFIKKLSI
jgi:hypothetical protein